MEIEFVPIDYPDNILHAYPLSHDGIVSRVIMNRVETQLNVLTRSMMTKKPIMIRGTGKSGYVTCLQTEDGSGTCWLVTLDDGSTTFVRLSLPQQIEKAQI